MGGGGRVEEALIHDDLESSHKNFGWMMDCRIFILQGIFLKLKWAVGIKANNGTIWRLELIICCHLVSDFNGK